MPTTREIKFRAWHTKQQKMYSATELGKDQMTLSVDGRGFINVHGCSRELSTFAGDIMIPMQYTGRKDKDGVEIFEEDLLLAKMEGSLQENLYLVEDIRVFYLDSNTPDLYVRINECKVIGNAYENPELLEEP